MPNKLKEIWADGRGTINGWCSIGSPFTAEIMAAQGYDSVCIDIQHGALDYSMALPMLQALRGTGVTPLVRVPWNEPGIIMKALDAGAEGIICPMVNSRAEAEALVAAMRYPPDGARSYGPTRVSVGAGPGYYGEANASILAFAMIETAEAVENVAEIAATPGLDGLYIGPADLTLGVTKGRLPPGFDRQEEEMVTVIKSILAAAKDAGKRAALHCGSAQYAAKAIAWGFDMTTVSGDVRLLAAAADASVREWRGLVGD
ncbi:2,4-dihydroxyhept-2-ene-1,7-dioic acid aldolase [Acuticoccus sediminis]|uniref:2,4-dihydroxyhept-2-ene-1,7-dioic acid aldolase n=1 Tax=Acuticoccus sediminis TaxID=2184697 RepID=A0A8B2NPL5_9HYPH|nr:aldolase/citrate lyase family protein [Acuticoccus sediminis]RAH97723.1 2,4-dihydroxyhept-2-ene-1,7-dioic acid aldolase [Acuticoccus sediminis]